MKTTTEVPTKDGVYWRKHELDDWYLVELRHGGRHVYFVGYDVSIPIGGEASKGGVWSERFDNPEEAAAKDKAAFDRLMESIWECPHEIGDGSPGLEPHPKPYNLSSEDPVDDEPDSLIACCGRCPYGPASQCNDECGDSLPFDPTSTQNCGGVPVMPNVDDKCDECPYGGVCAAGNMECFYDDGKWLGDGGDEALYEPYQELDEDHEAGEDYPESYWAEPTSFEDKRTVEGHSLSASQLNDYQMWLATGQTGAWITSLEPTYHDEVPASESTEGSMLIPVPGPYGWTKYVLVTQEELTQEFHLMFMPLFPQEGFMFAYKGNGFIYANGRWFRYLEQEDVIPGTDIPSWV